MTEREQIILVIVAAILVGLVIAWGLWVFASRESDPPPPPTIDELLEAERKYRQRIKGEVQR